MTYKDITVILLLFNTPHSSLKNLKNYKNFKTIILDQSNDSVTKKKVKKILPNIISYKISNKNFGFAKGINSLVKKTKTRFFLCTQPDVNISPDSILNLKKVFFKKKDAIISIPNLNYSKKKETKNKKNTLKEKKNAIGAIFLSEKKKFQDIGMFDENYFFYWEDVDLSKRINKSEYKIFLNSNSHAIHTSSKSTKLNLNSEFIRSSNFKFGEYYFQYKFDKLKLIKVVREPIINLISILFCLFVFKFNKALYKIFQLVGIFVFFKFIFLEKLK